MRLIALACVLVASVASAQGIVIPHDPHPVPDFCASSGAITGDQTIDTPTTPPSHVCVRDGATLTLRSALTVTTILVNAGGTLILEPGASITFTDTAPTDSGQYGTGLIVAGTLRALGTERTPFLRLAVEPAAGATTLTLESAPVGWQAGDRIVLPDSRHLKQTEVTNWAPTVPQWEARTIASVSGAVVTLTAPLTYAHPGARNADGGLEFLPHVGNLSRSIVIRSPAGAVNRGHVAITNRADADVRYVRFENLGRTTIAALNTTTNVAGRYPLHAHHLMGPTTAQSNGYQYTFLGNAIDGGDAAHTRKWGVAIHNSHYGLIQGNVVYNMAGSAFMFENGWESYNVVDGNLAVRSTGAGDRMSIGVEGGGFWFKGPMNYVRNNVAANLWGNTTEAAYGFKFFLFQLWNIRLPNYQGADTNVPGQYTTPEGNKLPILEFTNNEVYGSAQGLTYWWVNAPNGQPYAFPASTVSTFHNTSMWHVFNIGVYHYPSDKITFDGLKILSGFPPGVSACCGAGFFGSDYGFKDLVIRNANMQGMGAGVTAPTNAYGPMTVENSHFRASSGIVTSTMWNVNGGSLVKPRDLTVRNVTFSAWPGRTQNNINRNWETTSRPISAFSLPVRDDVKVYAYQGNTNDNFQLYYPVQATQNVAGGIAPCTTTRPELIGLACVIPGEHAPVDATYTDWAYASGTEWAPEICPQSAQQARTETWTRTLLTEPQYGGAYLPTSEQRPGTRFCTYIPPTIDVTCTRIGQPVIVGDAQVATFQCGPPWSPSFTLTVQRP